MEPRGRLFRGILILEGDASPGWLYIAQWTGKNSLVFGTPNPRFQSPLAMSTLRDVLLRYGLRYVTAPPAAIYIGALLDHHRC
jgi:hypothetical protein